MRRRLTALLAILALALTILPGIPNLVSQAPSCCNGTMCPMHEAQGHPMSCDMAGKDSGSQMKCCPAQPVSRYTATIVFILFAPATLQSFSSSEPALAFLPHLSPDALHRVDSPPPRLSLSA